MDVASINALAEEHLVTAATAESGRSSVTVYGRPGAHLRQTVVALAAGRVMAKHKSLPPHQRPIEFRPRRYSRPAP